MRIPAEMELNVPSQARAARLLGLYEFPIPIPMVIPTGVVMTNKSPKMKSFRYDTFAPASAPPNAMPSKPCSKRVGSTHVNQSHPLESGVIKEHQLTQFKFGTSFHFTFR